MKKTKADYDYEHAHDESQPRAAVPHAIGEMMGYTADRITRLETQRDQIDAALAALAASNSGVEEYQIGAVRYRRGQAHLLHALRKDIEGQLSGLNALKDFGGKVYLQREREGNQFPIQS